MEMDYRYFTNLSQLITEIPEDSIVSRTLHEDDRMKIVLFGFAAGQALSEHTASQPATLTFLQGHAQLTLGEDALEAHAGTWVYMPARLSHSVQAKTPVVMLLLLLRDQE